MIFKSFKNLSAAKHFINYNKNYKVVHLEYNANNKKYYVGLKKETIDQKDFKKSLEEAGYHFIEEQEDGYLIADSRGLPIFISTESEEVRLYTAYLPFKDLNKLYDILKSLKLI